MNFLHFPIFKTKDGELASDSVSDSIGKYELEIPSGNYYLEINFISYDSQKIENIIISESEEIVKVVAME